mmetsp:Transcript_14792/g.28465  ORF Transcript_14792/g.28465 Transcript_14792/m.28465 type:complete len:229 (-) Transcript_14792:242-928(-)
MLRVAYSCNVETPCMRSRLIRQSNQEFTSGIIKSSKRTPVKRVVLGLPVSSRSPVAHVCCAKTVESSQDSCDERTSSKNLGQFRQLMAGLLGGAGVAHLVDLLGPNVLPATLGVVPFASLPFSGKLVALVWCALGPVVTVSFFATGNLGDRQALGTDRSLPADNSIRLYFLYEVLLACYCSLENFPLDEAIPKILQAMAVAVSVVVSLQVLSGRVQDKGITKQPSENL